MEKFLAFGESVTSTDSDELLKASLCSLDEYTGVTAAFEELLNTFALFEELEASVTSLDSLLFAAIVLGSIVPPATSLPEHAAMSTGKRTLRA
jgi:hypothetical protein